MIELDLAFDVFDLDNQTDFDWDHGWHFVLAGDRWLTDRFLYVLKRSFVIWVRIVNVLLVNLVRSPRPTPIVWMWRLPIGSIALDNVRWLRRTARRASTVASKPGHFTTE